MTRSARGLPATAELLVTMGDQLDEPNGLPL